MIVLKRREFDALPLIVSLSSCGCLCSVSLPRSAMGSSAINVLWLFLTAHGTMGWSAVCGSGISWSCSLFET